MQSANANTQITITVRHEEVTDALRDYATKKIQGLHLDYPKDHRGQSHPRCSQKPTSC